MPNQHTPAFPRSGDQDVIGLTKREYMATKILAGLVSGDGEWGHPLFAAAAAYRLADALEEVGNADLSAYEWENRCMDHSLPPSACKSRHETV